MPKTFRVMNQTKNMLVCEQARRADNFMLRLFGLMGKPGLTENHGLWLEPCADIHSMFMRFEFDALFLDKEGKVLHMEERMKPWRISKFVRGGRSVLELNPGVIAVSGTTIGDVCVFELNQ